MVGPQPHRNRPNYLFQRVFLSIHSPECNQEAITSHNRTEPVLDRDHSNSMYGTLNVRQHLGALSSSPSSTAEDHAIFQLAPLANWTVPTMPGTAPWEGLPVDLANE